jgi:hypothetical protein
MTNVGYHIRNGWLQKPPLGVQLNWAHPLSKGLVGCWLFNEGGGDKAYDLSGYNNHGTLMDMAFPPTVTSGWNPGKDGVGLMFDGSNDYVNCGNDLSLRISTFSIELWLKTATADRYVLTRGVSWDPGKTNYHIGITAEGTIGVRFHDTGGTLRSATFLDYAITDGTWHHVVGMHNAVAQKTTIYVDGIQGENVTCTTPPDTSSAGDLWIGKYTTALNGSIDSVKIYNRALSAFEIGWLYCEPYAMFEPATKYTIIDERLATDYVGGNVMAAELI